MLDRIRRRSAIGQLGQRPFGLGQAGTGVAGIGLMAGQFGTGGFGAALRHGRSDSARVTARAASDNPRSASRRASRARFSASLAAESGRAGLMGGGGILGPGLCGLGLTGHFGQLVHLLQVQRGG